MKTILAALLFAALAFLAPAAHAECITTNPVTYIDVYVAADGSVVVDVTVFVTVICPTASSGGGSGSTSHPGVYQWHSGGGRYWWDGNVGGVPIGHGEGTLSHDVVSGDDPDIYAPMPQEFDDPRQIAPPPD